MTTNKHYEKLIAILYTLEEKGISNSEQLKLPQNKALYEAYASAMLTFVSYVALMSNINKVKVNQLVRDGKLEFEDIQMEVMLHILKKTHKILEQNPVEKMVNYTYTIVNNHVDTLCRKRWPGKYITKDDSSIKFDMNDDNIDRGEISTDNRVYRKWCTNEISLDHPIKSDTNDDGVCFGDVIPDTTYDPARLAEEETEREVILRHVSLISRKPAEVLVYLCAAFEMKSNEIATFLMDNGVVTSCAKAIKGISERYDIPLAELQHYIKADTITEKDLKLDTNDEDKVIDQVYHLKSRAKNRILAKRKG